MIGSGEIAPFGDERGVNPFGRELAAFIAGEINPFGGELAAVIAGEINPFDREFAAVAGEINPFGGELAAVNVGEVNPKLASLIAAGGIKPLGSGSPTGFLLHSVFLTIFFFTQSILLWLLFASL